MNNEVESAKYHVLGFLAEQGSDSLKIANETKEKVICFIRELIDDECDEIKGAKILGVSLAVFDIESTLKES